MFSEQINFDLIDLRAGLQVCASCMGGGKTAAIDTVEEITPLSPCEIYYNYRGNINI